MKKRYSGETAMRTEAIWAYGGLALAHLRLAAEDRAVECAERALLHISTRTPVAFWTQHGTAATAEVLLTLLEQRPAGDPLRAALTARAAAACAGLRRYARRFLLGKAHALVWNGLLYWLTDRPRRAMQAWRRAIEVAQALDMPYERGRAHLEIGRHLAPEHAERRTHLEQARALFEQLGCAHDLERTRSELA